MSGDHFNLIPTILVSGIRLRVSLGKKLKFNFKFCDRMMPRPQAAGLPRLCGWSDRLLWIKRTLLIALMSLVVLPHCYCPLQFRLHFVLPDIDCFFNKIKNKEINNPLNVTGCAGAERAPPPWALCLGSRVIRFCTFYSCPLQQSRVQTDLGRAWNRTCSAEHTALGSVTLWKGK